jgi:hypothetical protein
LIGLAFGREARQNAGLFYGASRRLTLPIHIQPRYRRGFHEGLVLPEVGEGPSPRLQGRPPPWQGLRDLQVESAFQGAPALIPGSRRRFIRPTTGAAHAVSNPQRPLMRPLSYPASATGRQVADS